MSLSFFLLFALINLTFSLTFERAGVVRPKRQTEDSVEGKWHTGQWLECGKEGYQARSVYCADLEGNPINDRELADVICPKSEAPPAFQQCQREETTAQSQQQWATFSQGRWIVGDWSQCDPTIRGSFQHRQVACYNWKNCPVSDHLCSHSAKPETRSPCPFEDRRQ